MAKPKIVLLKSAFLIAIALSSLKASGQSKIYVWWFEVYRVGAPDFIRPSASSCGHSWLVLQSSLSSDLVCSHHRVMMKYCKNTYNTLTILVSTGSAQTPRDSSRLGRTEMMKVQNDKWWCTSESNFIYIYIYTYGVMKGEQLWNKKLKR